METKPLDLSTAERAYREGKPFLSDFDFDRLSGTDSGSGTFFAGNMIIHQRPLLSLRHTYDFDELLRWCKWLKYQLGYDPELAVEPKIDGVAISVVYDDHGRFLSAATKHCAADGFDVTAKIKAAGCVPEFGPEGEQITGEFVLSPLAFGLYKDTYKTARSLACAYLQNKSDELADAGFKFYPHGLGRAKGGYLERKERLCSIYGFQDFDFRTANADDLAWVFVRFIGARPYWNFDTDGMVFRVDDLEAFYSLGDNGRYPFGAIAFKWKELKKK